jgi:hypothetical protein
MVKLIGRSLPFDSTARKRGRLGQPEVVVVVRPRQASVQRMIPAEQVVHSWNRSSKLAIEQLFRVFFNVMTARCSKKGYLKYAPAKSIHLTTHGSVRVCCRKIDARCPMNTISYLLLNSFHNRLSAAFKVVGPMQPAPFVDVTKVVPNPRFSLLIANSVLFGFQNSFQRTCVVNLLTVAAKATSKRAFGEKVFERPGVLFDFYIHRSSCLHT